MNTEIETQIYEKRKEVKYDIRDLTTEFIYKKFKEGIEKEKGEAEGYGNILFIPDYQREFTWDEDRQSKLIESIILGLPIPFIFVAENIDGAWEIVDGSQRIRTIHSFIDDNLILSNLKSLPKINNLKFSSLDKSRQRKILDTALRFIVLSEETTDDVKFDMFERINLGSDLLKAMEKRKGLYSGIFTSFLYDYVDKNDTLNNILKISKALENRQERHELLLRFFALSEEEHIKDIKSISIFLDDYLKHINKRLQEMDESQRNTELEKYKVNIDRVVSFVDEYFPYGFRHTHNPQTKRSSFEAISLGVYLAIKNEKIRPNISKEETKNFIQSKIFKESIYINNKVHSKSNLFNRINTVYKFLTGENYPK